MSRRQTDPRRWLIVGPKALSAPKRPPRGSGVLLLEPLSPGEMRRLGRMARNRQLTIIIEGRRSAARVHNARELREALLARTPRILLSPIHSTASHPDWEPIPRMRAAALARLAGRRLIALGGMNEKRYAQLARLGFAGWAGISAFKT